MENLPPASDLGSGSGSSDVSGESSDSTFQLNIKTLDSRIFNFHVDKNILVTAFKEKIAEQTGVPVGQQRLIFRGKVLKDDHLLSVYNVEHGDTLHLVERQPQPPPGPNTGEATSRNDTGGQDIAGPRSRIGLAHSVVLGTVNVGDPGEAVVPDLSQVIGAVLSSIGMGNLAGGMQPGVQASHGNETEPSPQVNDGSQSQGGNQFGPFQASHGQSASNSMQRPELAVPSLNMPLPDSLSTLVEFMNRMELALSQNGTEQNQSSTVRDSPPTPELPLNSYGYPSAEALTVVLRHAQHLLSDHVVPALSRTAGRLEQEGGGSSDPALRGQLQTESAQLGVAMQHLGALLLELGRTILTLRIGPSSGESFVNAGPAVYISPSGPNPIMVQPFPLQTSSLFGGSSGIAPNHVAMGPAGSVTRNVNIHIHTGTALAPIVPMMGNRAPNGEEMGGQQVDGASGESGQAQVPSGVNATTRAVRLRPAIISVSGAIQPGSGVPRVSVANVNTRTRNRATRRQSQNQAPSANQEQPAVSGGGDNDTSSHPGNLSSSIVSQATQTSVVENQKDKTDPSTSSNGGSQNLEAPPESSQGNNSQDGYSGLPRGLGLGGLQPKKRGAEHKSKAKKSDDASSSRAVGQHVLQSLASSLSTRDANPPSSEQPSDPSRGILENTPSLGQNTNGSTGMAAAVSQVLSSPSLDGILAGVSQQTGVGSLDVVRNMLQQFTQNPAVMNTVSRMAQQMDDGDLEEMFAGRGFDYSSMMQQMMPIVSQALGGGISSGSQVNVNPPPEHVVVGNSTRRDVTPTTDDPQIYFEVAQRLEEQSSSEEIFRSMVDGVVQLSVSESAEESVVDELCSQSGLAEEFMDMLVVDLSRRLEGGM